VANESEFTHVQTVNALRIAREEIAHLEQNAERVHHDNAALRDRNAHLEGIIYGNSQRRAGSVRKQQEVSTSFANTSMFNVAELQRSNMSTVSGAAAGDRVQAGRRLSFSALNTNPAAGTARGRTKQRGTAQPSTHSQSQADMATGPRPAGCSRSPTRCWAAATLVDRENKNNLNRSGTAAGAHAMNVSNTSMLMF
jgi:hypothetical protein